MNQDWDAEDIYQITPEFGPCENDDAARLASQLQEELRVRFPTSRVSLGSMQRRFSEAYSRTQNPADYWDWKTARES